MNLQPRSNPRAAVLALCALAGACRSVAEREFALALSARGFPGAGAGVELSQCMVESGERRIDFELGLERQKLADEGPAGDDWTRIWAGLRCAAAQPGAELQGAAGVTWLRSEGETDFLDPGDYGGLYLGAGWVFALTPALGTGPEATLLYVDSEGDASGSGAVFELAWRLVWSL